MKEKCIFVIGPESSGSTFIAKVISTALNGDTGWNGRGFNCCNKWDCDRENGFTKSCSEVKHLVCHRSLPFGEISQWPPISEWEDFYDANFILCTRDASISSNSVLDRMKRTQKSRNLNLLKSTEIIKDIIGSESKSMIWSYETFVLLQEAYLKQLYDFLKIKSDYLPDSIIDANSKYIK
ncbi:hypothetical protein [Owenweeksia hongkongensis]|uniref:hypothetical protein n=1 Tax=Owenweeksia hongkongensis TaxID=253245 RepID=UPI003A8CAC02